MRALVWSVIKSYVIPLAVVAVIAAFVASAVVPPMTSDGSATTLSSYSTRRASIALTSITPDPMVGEPLQLSGQLSGVKNANGAKIMLRLVLPDGSTTYPTQGSSTTASQGGGFVIEYLAIMAGEHTFTATYGAGRDRVTATKGVTVSAADVPVPEGPVPIKVATSIDLALRSSSVTTGSSLRATGMLKAEAGIPYSAIKVTIVSANGAIAYPSQGREVITDSSGRFTADYAPIASGAYSLTATFEGNGTYDPSVATAPFTAVAPSIVAKVPTSMKLVLVTSAVEVENSVHADGTLSGIGPITGATVALKVTLPDGTVTYPAQGASTRTDSLGKFIIDYKMAKPGAYKLTATFSGTNDLEGSSVSASFAASSPVTSNYKYIVTKDGSTYYAKNSNGGTIASGTSAAAVINAALNSLTPGRAAKERVLVQCSAPLTARINMPSYSILECAPGTVFTESGVTQLIGSKGTHDWEIVGGEWVCTDKTVTSASTPMYFESPLHCIIRDCKVRDSMWNNIILDDARYTTIYNVESYRSWTLDAFNTEANGWHGIIFEGSANNCVVDSCYLHDNGHGGCYFFTNEEGGPGQLNDNVMRNNRVERCGTSGLSISQRSTAAEGHRNLIENNTLVDCGLDTEHPFINVGWNPGCPAYYNVVRNNVIIDNGVRGPTGTGADEGIIVSGDRTEVYGNDIRGCSCAIFINGNTGVSVHDNYIHDAPGENGVFGNAYDSYIVNNTGRNVRSLVSVSGTGNTIRDNTMVS